MVQHREGSCAWGWWWRGVGSRAMVVQKISKEKENKRQHSLLKQAFVQKAVIFREAGERSAGTPRVSCTVRASKSATFGTGRVGCTMHVGGVQFDHHVQSPPKEPEILDPRWSGLVLVRFEC